MEEQQNQKISAMKLKSRIWPAFIFGFILPQFFFVFLGISVYIGVMGVIGLVFGIWWLISGFTAAKRRWGKLIIVIFSVISSIFFIGRTVIPFTYDYIKLAIEKETFSGSSDNLENTIIVPTFDAAVPEHKNVIWCSSFQLAWNELAKKLPGSAVKLDTNEPVVSQMNNSFCSGNDLESDSYYADAGYVRDGIIPKIQKNLRDKFPFKNIPDFSTEAYLIAYAYMNANVKFEIPFRKNDDKFIFKDSSNKETNVESFGLWKGFLPHYRKMREQVEVLYYLEHKNNSRRMSEFAIDLCKKSKPYQIVVAVIERPDSLDQGYLHIQKQIENFSSRNFDKNQIHGEDIIIVPEMFWEIGHRFKELEGKIVTNAEPPGPIGTAMQRIKFKLDRSGAFLESEAFVEISAVPRKFVFDRPFLIYLKKRGAENPFFIMWVDNAELLIKK